MIRRNRLTRTLWILSLVSLFMDMASEMLYPIMPLYLRQIGFSIVLIGVLEGVAEATAGLSKGYFGQWSDIKGERLPFVRTGYALSALAKPLLVVVSWPLWVFSARTLDRLGKGVRTGARDAMLATEGSWADKGAVFGFHRSMDTLGAAIGPVLALIFLWHFPGAYKTLFYIAFAPGLISVGLTYLLKEKNKPTSSGVCKVGFLDFLHYIPSGSLAYKRLLAGLLGFALFNSSDIFLLLMLKHLGMSDYDMIMVYIFYNLIFAVFAYPAGLLADRIGLKQMLITGLIIFVLTYSGMAWIKTPIFLYLLFFLYGLYAACTEGVSKAWISIVCKKEELATAIGTYEGLRSVITLISSALAGLVWFYYGPSVTFMLSATMVTTVALYITFYCPYDKR